MVEYRLPQIILEGVVKQGQESKIITFAVHFLRLVRVSFIVPVPREGSFRVPVYARFAIEKDREDPPGSVKIE